MCCILTCNGFLLFFKFAINLISYTILYMFSVLMLCFCGFRHFYCQLKAVYFYFNLKETNSIQILLVNLYN